MCEWGLRARVQGGMEARLFDSATARGSARACEGNIDMFPVRAGNEALRACV